MISRLLMDMFIHIPDICQRPGIKPAQHQRPVNPVADWEKSVYFHPVKRTLALPDSPAVVAGFGHAAILTPDGELLTLPSEEAAALLRTLPPPILVHAPATFRRLGLRP